MDERAELADILRKNSLFEGEFTLASGKKSPYYFDCKRTTLYSPRGLLLAVRSIYARLRSHEVDAIGGLTIGCAPLAIGVSQAALVDGWNLPVFVVRKEPKPHGRQRLIEGHIEPSWRVAIVDDVITTGDSIMQAINAVQDAGATVARVIVLVDREEGGAEVLRDYPLESIFSVRELR